MGETHRGIETAAGRKAVAAKQFRIGDIERRVRENLAIQTAEADGPEPDFDKLASDLNYGDTVAIEWQGELLEGVTDYGYVFAWPGRDESGDANMGGIVHIPHPQNPGGKDRADPEWVTLYELLTNPMVKSVRTVAAFRDAVRAATQEAQ